MSLPLADRWEARSFVDTRASDSIVVSRDAELPYSKGLMAKTLMAAGIPPHRAYEHALQIQLELARRGDGAITTDGLFEVAADVVQERESQAAVTRLRRLRALRDLDVPLIVLIGGATGVGKSSVATEVAHRLAITRVTSTDFIRQTMRAFFSKECLPSIHYSSFDAARTVALPECEPAQAVVLGFLDQTQNVLVGVKAIVERALDEGLSMVLEGIHLVPGLVPSSFERAVVASCVIAVAGEDEHASRLRARDAASAGRRPVERYLAAFRDIRLIDEYVLERARKADVPIISNTSFERTVGDVLELVLERVESATAGRRQLPVGLP